MILQINLLDPRLFGNEAGDDEDERTLAAYFVDKPEFSAFENDDRPLAICRARKGMGKSALLNYLAFSKSKSPMNIVFRVKGSSITDLLDKNSETPQRLIQSWKSAILTYLEGRVEETKVSLDETPESLFGRDENFASRLLQFHKKGIFWLCIDDIDATYRRSPEEDLTLSAFFSAARDLVQEQPALRLRISVREDVWSSIKTFDEALDKCEQYMLDIAWSRTGMRTMLAKRVRHYLALRRTEHQLHGNEKADSPSIEATKYYERMNDQSILTKLFPQYYPWGAGNSEQYQVIHVLSAGRPRWALQLARMTAGIAHKHSDSVLKFGYMKEILPKYSQFRVTDLIREHFHQCPKVEDLVFAFSVPDKLLSTTELLNHIDRNISRLVDVYIDRCQEKATTLDIAHFLFRIGFIEAIDKINAVNHYHYDDSPHLLRSLTAPHDHINWRVRPSYHAALS